MDYYKKENKIQPLISVLMTTHNDLSLLDRAIESVIVQTGADWELIILDNSDKGDAVFDRLKEWAAIDSRIRIFRGAHSVGWSKGASLCLEKATGKYATFLASDDKIAEGAFERIRREDEKRNGCDIIFIGNLYVQLNEDQVFQILGGRMPPSHFYDKVDSDSIVRILREVYYNSMFHYEKIEFLRENDIDFWEPYYSDCGSMTCALTLASKISVVEDPLYYLTGNTSQTKGWYTKGSLCDMFGLQWRLIRDKFEKEGFQNAEIIRYSAIRIAKNAIAMMRNMDINRFRDKYMNSVSATRKDMIYEMEKAFSDRYFSEMYAVTSNDIPSVFDMISEIFADVGEAIEEESFLYPCYRYAALKDKESEEGMKYLLEWLMTEQNQFAIGFEELIRITGLIDQSIVAGFTDQMQELFIRLARRNEEYPFSIIV